MKYWLLPLLLLSSGLAHARIGPDLSEGVNVGYFTKLRLDYAKSPGAFIATSWNLAPERKKITEAYGAGDVDQVLTLADAWLKKCPVDADTHLRVAMCCKEKWDLPGYNYHLGVFYGLLQSITSSGDGLTAKTGFKVICIAEEYSLIQEIGGKVEMQSLVGMADKMDISRKGSKKTTIYFDASIVLEAEARELSPTPKESK